MRDLHQHNLRVGYIGLGSADSLYGSPDCMVRGGGGGGGGRQVCTLAAREAIQSCAGDSPGIGLYVEAKKVIKVTLVDGNRDVVQLMAMAITSGFTQCNRHSSLPSLIPSVLICPTITFMSSNSWFCIDHLVYDCD